MSHSLSPAEQLAHSTVRIETAYPDGSRGTGTGFFYRFAQKEKTHVPCIVTNRHVIEGVKSGQFLMTLQNGAGGPDYLRHEMFNFDDFERHWHRHPDPDIDLVAMPIAPLMRFAESRSWKFFYVGIDHSLIPSEQDIADFIGLESVTMIGYPNGLWDKTHNLPLFRRGVIASHYQHDWNGKKEFLIDCACFPGSSGSPVFLFETGGYQTRSGVNLGATRIKLLGVLYAGPQHTVTGEITVVNIPVQHRPISISGIPNNLGIIIKSDLLRAFDAVFEK